MSGANRGLKIQISVESTIDEAEIRCKMCGSLGQQAWGKDEALRPKSDDL
jgi:hypothetical protein